MPAKVPSRTKPKSGSVPPLWNEWANNVEIREVAVDAVDFRVDRDRLGAKKMPPVQIRFRLDPKARTVAGNEATLCFEFELLMTDQDSPCLLYTSDAADEEDSVDLGGRRIIK